MIGNALLAGAVSDPSLLVAEPKRRVLITVDALGGVWRYSMDLAAALGDRNFEFVFVGLGPELSLDQRHEAECLGELVWLDAPLDWITDREASLDQIPDLLGTLVDQYAIDLVHLNLPSQAAGLDLAVPLVVVSHSCVVTWFAAVRNSDVPEVWHWQKRRNRRGFDAADAVVAPSHAHAAMLRRSYGPIGNLEVVHNASRLQPEAVTKEDFVFAAGRWWDEGKNAVVLDEAARTSRWPVVMAGADRGPSGQHVTIERADHRGVLPFSEVVRLASRAGIAVSPSLYEPFGLAALEAARAGAALVLSDIPIYRELWDGAALFADPNDPQAFASGINRLADQPELRAHLAGQAFARSNAFTLAAQASAMERIYRQLLQRRDLPMAI
jgi:glycosyltransferase involved in cell wall biosynthesis